MPHGHDATLIVDDRYQEVDVDLFHLLGGGEPRQAEFTGIRALMLAVLDDAIVVYLGQAGLARDEAEAWIASEQRRSPFAFVVVCEMLGLEPEPVRVALRGWRERSMPARRALGRTRKNAQARGSTLRVVAVR